MQQEEIKKITPNNFINGCTAISTVITIHSEQDCGEFLHFLLDRLKFEFTQIENQDRGIIDALFKGSTKIIIKCTNCTTVKEHAQDFYQLGLPMPKEGQNLNYRCMQCPEEFELLKQINEISHRTLQMFSSDIVYTLYDSVKSFSVTEENEAICDVCKKSTIHQFREQIAVLPKYLVIYFKRFRKSRWRNKISRKVYLPAVLNSSGIGVDSDTRYSLIAVVQHKGYLFKGHYKSFICCRGLWYSCNDTKIRQCSWERVLKTQAYMCLYEAQELNYSAQ